MILRIVYFLNLHTVEGVAMPIEVQPPDREQIVRPGVPSQISTNAAVARFVVHDDAGQIVHGDTGRGAVATWRGLPPGVLPAVPVWQPTPHYTAARDGVWMLWRMAIPAADAARW